RISLADGRIFLSFKVRAAPHVTRTVTLCVEPPNKGTPPLLAILVVLLSCVVVAGAGLAVSSLFTLRS
ncbi:MAG TPA: hypothetical protein VNH64_04085, partial [Parvularculaceae bacterium]|nr:hypothetical protein [Parvularculaceae bacterium]